MKKIGEIKGVPVVEGNVNEVTKNQIHYKEEEGGIQLSKRDNDNRLNNITSGSSEGEGVKEYYYKMQDSLINDKEAIVEMTKMYYMLFNRVDTLSKLNDDVVITSICTEYSSERTSGIGYFKVVDYPFYLPSYDEYGKLLRVTYMNGDFYRRMSCLQPNVSIDEIKAQMSQIIKEITKEEYESLITYTPEL